MLALGDLHDGRLWGADLFSIVLDDAAIQLNVYHTWEHDGENWACTTRGTMQIIGPAQ